MGQPGLKDIFNAELPQYDKENVDIKVQQAIYKYRNRKSTREDRRRAVRDLADILEFLRPKLKLVLGSKDERELFNIANNYYIRHHNDMQKSDYSTVWLSWIFYLYLSTIHLAIRLINEQEGKANGE
ncbi:MAG: hypothetical protein GX366_09470 [Epulopiscium sp.]|nr:hypothetical protein [Candidatus Epulonipiscium sp.]